MGECKQDRSSPNRVRLSSSPFTLLVQDVVPMAQMPLQPERSFQRKSFRSCSSDALRPAMILPCSFFHCFVLVTFFLALVYPCYGGPRSDIPGSTATTHRGSQFLRARLACFKEKGEWKLNEAPRKLPWVRRSYGLSTPCDSDPETQNGPEGAKDGVHGGTGAPLWGLRADRAARKGEAWDVPAHVKWEWKAEHCEWQPFNYRRFCRTMHDGWGRLANIFFIGGEHMWGLEKRFSYHMAAQRPKNTFHLNLFPDGCGQWKVPGRRKLCSGFRYCQGLLGNDSVAVRYLHSTDLTLGSEGLLPWNQGVPKFGAPSVLLINYDVPGASLAEMGAAVEKAIWWIRTRSKVVLVIYVSTPLERACSGTPDEDTEVPPPLSEAEKERYMEQNRVAKNVTSWMGALYLDLDAPTQTWSHIITSPNEDTDHALDGGSQPTCVNACQPGLADSWVQLVYNAIIAARQSFDGNSADESASDGSVSEDLHSVDDDDDEEEDQGVDVTKYVVPAQKRPPFVKQGIPGSRIDGDQAAESAKDWFNCYTGSGEWVEDVTPRPLPWPRFPLNDRQICDLNHVEQGGVAYESADAAVKDPARWKVRPNLLWEWQTQDCPLLPLVRNDFCKLLGSGRSILLLGDSLQLGLFRTLYSFLVMGVDLEKYPSAQMERIWEWEVETHPEICEGIQMCGDILASPVTLRVCYNQHLTLGTVTLPEEAPWVLKLEEWDPTIVVMNSGAHYEPDDLFLKHMQDALWHVRAKLPDALVIWRTSPPGHVNCTHYSGPITRRQDPALLPPHYHWADFTRQNRLVQRLVEQVGGVMMDIEHLTALRPDGHVGVKAPGAAPDCLHYCRPGPMDTWVRILYNMLWKLL
eukprot:TRINITY_DN26375_c0_g1_i1.p1 TRINITY_DN26375_c0_g1~~TRINITY_DN26375_c0_g1_i1.p1  ORF type:complete len:859 (-),score=77.82 TRINITY_DN26375_c0_g1_i1:586-3162(-)